MNNNNKKRQFNKIRKAIYEQNEKLSKDGNQKKKKNQTKILELKNTVNEMTGAMESSHSRMGAAEENP